MKQYQYEIQVYDADRKQTHEEKFYVNKSIYYEDIIKQLIDKLVSLNIAIDPSNLWITVGTGLDEKEKYVVFGKVD